MDWYRGRVCGSSQSRSWRFDCQATRKYKEEKAKFERLIEVWPCLWTSKKVPILSSDQSATLIDKVQWLPTHLFGPYQIGGYSKGSGDSFRPHCKVAGLFYCSSCFHFCECGHCTHIGKLLNAYFWGFIIMSLFYLLLAFILYKFRHQLIHKTIGSSIIDQLLDQVKCRGYYSGETKRKMKR